MIGAGMLVPSSEPLRSRTETSRNIRGTIRQRENACAVGAHRRLRARAPRHIAEGLLAEASRAAASSSATATGSVGRSPPSPRP